ncbi:MAG TPA: hypothetical protein EYP56_17080 [Planctomycetaceae bacterium]|nr:hypothetical protein [Planctomycetaceae bacterium]HIQ21870.1 hypothetical protein [Planctomycetota bacterium]
MSDRAEAASVWDELLLIPLALWLVAVGLGSEPPGASGAEVVVVVPPCARPLEIALVVAADAVGTAGSIRLVEQGAGGCVLPADLLPGMDNDGTVSGEKRRLAAVIPPCGEGAGERRFIAVGEQEPRDARFVFRDIAPESLGLFQGAEPVYVYNHGVIVGQSVPESDRRRQRSCYIHPLYGLSGEVLTDDFPRDHYHHHGVFWTWPHVRIDGQEYDLWADRGIEQRFVRWLCRHAGRAAAVLAVENGWFIGDRKVMVERIWVRAYRRADGTRSVDLEMVWIAVDRPVTLWGAPGKSYGGLTVRFAPPSRNDPSTVITVPSGPTTADLPDTRLEWADFTSRFGDETARSGAAVFVHPAHPDYPPTWLTRHYGPLCVGWPGVKPKTFPPGEPFRLDYRIWVHKGPVTTEELAGAYDAYKTAVEAVRWEPGP